MLCPTLLGLVTISEFFGCPCRDLVFFPLLSPGSKTIGIGERWRPGVVYWPVIPPPKLGCLETSMGPKLVMRVCGDAETQCLSSCALWISIVANLCP